MIAGLLINFFEILAFLTGIFYYQKNKTKPTLYLVWFLGITVFSELFSWYTYFVESGFLHFLKGTRLEMNYWWGNMYSIISYLFYINYFKWYLSAKRSISILNSVSVIVFVVSILEIIFSEGFFIRFMPISNVIGTLFVFLSISFYYLELLKSDQILQVQKTLPFYISVGALLFHLCTTPIFIYSIYFSNSVDPSFVSLYKLIIFSANYLLYSIYIAGFLICLRKKDPYSPKKNF
ncbi:hypothetical protein AEQU3_02969 [Aequorivita antarctica]|nr:hypothetical protein AEQU3_02969 [Aequorivita antarctica]